MVSGSTCLHSSGPVSAHQAFASSCQADFGMDVKQKDPGKESGGIWVLDGCQSSAS